MADHTYAISGGGGERAGLNVPLNSNNMALLKQLLQTPTLQATAEQGRILNFGGACSTAPLSEAAINQAKLTKKVWLLQKLRENPDAAAAAVMAFRQQRMQQQLRFQASQRQLYQTHQSQIRNHQHLHQQQTPQFQHRVHPTLQPHPQQIHGTPRVQLQQQPRVVPVASHPEEIQPQQPSQPNRNDANSNEPIPKRSKKRKFKLRSDTSPEEVAFKASFRIAEIEEFARSFVEQCQSVDSYLYDSLVVQESILPSLEANNKTLEQQREELCREYKRLVEENTTLSANFGALTIKMASEEEKSARLFNQLKTRDKEYDDVTKSLNSVTAELQKSQNEVANLQEICEKQQVALKTKDETIEQLENHQKRLKKKRLDWRAICRKHAGIVASLKNKNKLLLMEVSNQKQNVRSREEEMDTLKTEMEMMSLESSRFQNTTLLYKKQCEELIKQAAQLKRCLAVKRLKRRQLIAKYPGWMMNNSSLKRIKKVNSVREERKRKVIIALANKQKLGVKESGKQKTLKEVRANAPELKKDCKSSTLMESENAENIVTNHGDAKQIPLKTKVKITLPQLKLLQESVAANNSLKATLKMDVCKHL